MIDDGKSSNQNHAECIAFLRLRAHEHCLVSPYQLNKAGRFSYIAKTAQFLLACFCCNCLALWIIPQQPHEELSISFRPCRGALLISEAVGPFLDDFSTLVTRQRRKKPFVSHVHG